MRYYFLLAFVHLSSTAFAQLQGHMGFPKADQEVLSHVKEAKATLKQLKKVQQQFKSEKKQYDQDSTKLWQKLKKEYNDSISWQWQNLPLDSLSKLPVVKEQYPEQVRKIQTRKGQLQMLTRQLDSLKQLIKTSPDSLINQLGKRSAKYLERHKGEILAEEQQALANLEKQATANEYFVDPEGGKEQVIQRTTRALNTVNIDISDKIAPIQEQMNKLKQKYASVQSMQELLEDPPNPLYDLSFSQRLIYGNHLVILSGDHVALDFSPFIGYRLNNRFSTGIALLYRLNFISYKKHQVHHLENDVIGLKTFAEYQTRKGFLGYLEVENARKIIAGQQTDIKTYDYVYAINVGVGKTFRLMKNWHSQVTVLYDLLHDKERSIMPTAINFRIGLRWQYLR
jgi:hypothetical protein